MATDYSAFYQVSELLATLEPKKVLELKASPEVQSRLELLIEKSKETPLNKAEKGKLDHYIVLERLMRRAKIGTHA